ncbi:MAG: 30S ribosomal protein S17e [Candidatus Diapherotrites archaeon]
MGKAVPRNIKQRANQLIEEFPEETTSDFEKNKAFINSMEMPFPKKTRNLMAGFITRQKKQKA